MVIGREMDQDAVTSKFDMCLLTDDEMALGPEGWRSRFNDPFPKWREVTEEELLTDTEGTIIRG
mgnify:FL=1